MRENQNKILILNTFLFEKVKITFNLISDLQTVGKLQERTHPSARD